MSLIDNLEGMLATGNDNGLLRFTLGQAYLKESRLAEALAHLEVAVRLSPGYSAAWKLYGKALGESGRIDEAMRAYEAGISVATDNGDVQAAKEMQVFQRRLEKKPKAT